jgi:DNA polymerase-3 subunit gamma/tau
MLVKRINRTGANDLHTIYRPCRVDEFLGNKTNMNTIRKGLDSGTLSHTMLFVGDAGCGKTTAARVIALGLNCLQSEISTSKPCLQCTSCESILNGNDLDVIEINVGADSGKDAVNEIVKDLPQAPFNSRYKILIFDEAHRLSNAAQALLLKVIEEGYSHVYFIFCTNEPEKLSEAFMTRCNIMNFNRLSTESIRKALEDVAESEAMVPRNPAVLDLIAQECKGVSRVALVWLKQVADEGSWTIEAAKEIVGIMLDETDANIVDISKAILQGSFKEAIAALDKIKSKNSSESIRIGIAAYIVGCLKRAKSYQDGIVFSKMLDVLTIPIYEQGKPGEYKLYNYIFKATAMKVGKI